MTITDNELKQHIDDNARQLDIRGLSGITDDYHPIGLIWDYSQPVGYVQIAGFVLVPVTLYVDGPFAGYTHIARVFQNSLMVGYVRIDWYVDNVDPDLERMKVAVCRVWGGTWSEGLTSPLDRPMTRLVVGLGVLATMAATGTLGASYDVLAGSGHRPADHTPAARSTLDVSNV